MVTKPSFLKKRTLQPLSFVPLGNHRFCRKCRTPDIIHSRSPWDLRFIGLRSVSPAGPLPSPLPPAAGADCFHFLTGVCLAWRLLWYSSLSHHTFVGFGCCSRSGLWVCVWGWQAQAVVRVCPGQSWKDRPELHVCDIRKPHWPSDSLSPAMGVRRVGEDWGDRCCASGEGSHGGPPPSRSGS